MSNFYAHALRKHGIELDRSKTLVALNEQVEAVMNNPAAQPGLLRILFSDFAVPIKTQELGIRRFQAKRPRLLVRDFAPYAGFCLKANLLLGIGGGLLKDPHPHDLRDLEYCYYLPFCHVFASADRLHRKLAPMLMRPDQMFVGAELVDDLRRLGDGWNKLTIEEKAEFARAHQNRPPEQEGSVTRAIWERYSGPDAPHFERTKQTVDPFFRDIIRKSRGPDQLDDFDIEQADFLVQKTEMTRARLQELYPGFDLDE